MLADDPAAEAGPTETARDLGEVGETLRDPGDAADDAADAPGPALADPVGAPPAGHDDTGPTDQEPTQGTTEATEEPPKRSSKRRGRASVPSWDEIMFGGGKGE